MSPDELDCRLVKVRDRMLATEVRRFVLNILLLFDGSPPPHIQLCIDEIMELLESKQVHAPARHSL